MKLTKDQIQKIFLSSLLMIGLIYCYFTFLIDPLGRRDKNNAAAIEELDGKLATARTEIKRSKSVQDQAKTAEETLAQVGDMVPEGAPIAWFPPRIKAFFDRHNIKNTTVQSVGMDAVDATLGGYRNAHWTINIPQASMTQLGIALAGLENEEKLLEITRLQITSVADSPEKQHVSMNVVTLLK